jgi:hypothetical protein
MASVAAGPALHAAAQRIAATSAPKQTGFGGQTTAGAIQRSVSGAKPPKSFSGVGAAITKAGGSLAGAKNTTAAPKAARAVAPKAPAATSTGLTNQAYNISQPLSGQNLQNVVNTETTANTNAALAPLQANAKQLTGQEQTISSRLAGYDQLYNAQLQQNAANAPAQSAGAVGGAQAAGQVGAQGVSGTQAAIQQAISSSPELAGAAADGGARAQIAQEIAAQRLAQASVTGANVGYAQQVGGNAGQLANTQAGAGIQGSAEGQAGVAGTFSRALAANTANEAKVTANIPADRMKLFTALRSQGFTQFATLAGLGTKSVAAAIAQQNANTNTYKATTGANTAAYNAATTRANDQQSRALQSLSINVTAAHNDATTRIAALNAQTNAGRLTETQRHNHVAELQGFQKALKPGGTTAAQKAQNTAVGLIQGIGAEYKNSQDKTLFTDPKKPPLAPGVAASQLEAKYAKYGSIGTAAVEYGRDGFISAATQAALQKQGVTVPASMTRRPAALPVPATPAPVFGRPGQAF